jgi:hypothetical protein
MDGIAGLIDLARYPLDDLASPRAQAMVAEVRRQMASGGSCVLPGFVPGEAVAGMAAEAGALVRYAHRTAERASTAYLQAPDERFPERHPMRRLQTSSVGAVAYDLIPTHSAIRRLYEWEGLLRFLERALDRAPMYRYADPLGALNIAVMKEGEALLWHFDQTDFVVSILLQGSESGGVFEYVPGIRSDDAANYEAVERVLDGAHDGVLALDMAPGTLAMFEGRNSIHRVTAVKGGTPRLIALLGYDTKPATLSTDRLKLARYGRVA